LLWTDQSKEMLETILLELNKEGIQPGDRRQFKAIHVTRAYAWLCGSDRVEPEHLEVLTHVLWNDPVEQPEKVAQVVAKIANPVGMRLNQMLLECEQIISASDLSNLSQAATATKKLQEIDKQLSALPGNGRVEKTRTYVREQIKRIKLASIEAL
jgi:MoxR-like ATPase